MQSECWVKAMNAEILALVKNATCRLVDLPPQDQTYRKQMGVQS